MSYSLNVPVPGAVERLTTDLYPQLTAFDTIRDRHTLVVKRFENQSYDRLRETLRTPLANEPAFEARITGIDTFERPTRGDGPVVYLTVDSPGLFALHDRLVDRFGAIEGLEGDDYVPHVTLARGGSPSAVEALRDVEFDPVRWTVTELDIWSAEYREVAGSIPLRG
ncbi:phosphoesterase [Haloprofundus marisrubri]|uniref:Phosphoesterase n=1 Tax=Haloprofundus marisrubri TaxID=1514971 RepID=A0A0W1R4C1_9EURY|nr:2'-5' RNA ligase family protein [Haloprofundus marisrubri]KTG07949.1 phosphoesterase [Haloprofundus marisrubri]